MTPVQHYQSLLSNRGFYKSTIDGDFGPLTLKASIAYYQSINGHVPEWMIWAAAELGQKEIYGSKANPRIVYYHSFTDLGAKSDEIAWCASFVNAALFNSDVKGTKSAAAASFKDFGKNVNPEIFGAILLKETNTGSHRHVFFNAGSNGDYIFGLGGNQSNAVTVAVYTKKEITESRYPSVN